MYVRLVCVYVSVYICVCTYVCMYVCMYVCLVCIVHIFAALFHAPPTIETDCKPSTAAVHRTRVVSGCGQTRVSLIHDAIRFDYARRVWLTVKKSDVVTEYEHLLPSN